MSYRENIRLIQITVSAGVNHDKNKLVIFLFPDKKPI